MRLPAASLLPRAAALVPRRLGLPGMHWRRRLLALAAVALVLGAAYQFWFRGSSFVRVEHVEVVGLSTAPDAPRLRRDLTAAARRMTTLDVDADALRRTVAADPVVHAIEVRADFPHGLTIDVVENRPVALVSAGGRDVPVAADGTVLEGVDVSGSLPVLRTAALPGGRRVDGGGLLDRVTVAGAAPQALLARVSTITIQPGKGFVAQLENGPAIWLGSGARLDAKWTAAAAVLAQRTSEGAAYVDVRVPERAVAGGLPASSLPSEPAADSPAQPPAGSPQPAYPAAAGSPATGTAPAAGAAPPSTTAPSAGTTPTASPAPGSTSPPSATPPSAVPTGP